MVISIPDIWQRPSLPPSAAAPDFASSPPPLPPNLPPDWLSDLLAALLARLAEVGGR